MSMIGQCVADRAESVCLFALNFNISFLLILEYDYIFTILRNGHISFSPTSYGQLLPRNPLDSGLLCVAGCLLRC